MQTDVCVIGSGPAGTTLALRLAQLGHAVSLVERAEFPRRHLGESLTPGVRVLLTAIGAGEIFEDACVSPVHSVQVNWDAEPRERTDPEARGALVDRGRFDALLLEHARVAGVRVLQPATFRECQPSANGWEIKLQQGGVAIDFSAHFLADASGRTFATRGRKRRTGAPTTAFYAYWRGSASPSRPRIDANADGWSWGVPLPDRAYNALIFVDPRAHGPVHYHQWIARSGLLEELRGAQLASPVLAADATSYIDEKSVTARSIKVGDAALAVDPLSSSGVQKAIQSSLAGAVVVNTLLRKPESGEDAMRFYRSTLADASDRHSRWAGENYGRAAAIHSGEFWRRRASAITAGEIAPAIHASQFADAPLALSPKLRFVDSPCIVGDFVAVRSALDHPFLDGPVTFVGGCELPPLVWGLHAAMKPMEIARLWSDRVPLKTALALTGWMVSKGLLIPVVP